MHGRKRTPLTRISLAIFLISAMVVFPFGYSVIIDKALDSRTNEPLEPTFSKDSFEGMNDIPSMSKFPISNSCYFTKNMGQWENHIRYLAVTSFGHVALSNDGIYYYLIYRGEGRSIKISFQNAQLTAPIGVGDIGFESNYFYGNDAIKWTRNVRSYNKVQYKNVWPGIDILYYFVNGYLKYDIIVGKYSDPKFVSFCIEAHMNLNIDEGGLRIQISENITISDTNLVAFYKEGTVVPIHFKKTSENTFGFEVEKAEGKTLIIDPVVFSTSTFLGGSGYDYSVDITTDNNDNIIILGTTSSSDFPNTTGAYQTDVGDIVLSKMNKNATELIFSTYLGGVGRDYPFGIEVDENNDIYMSGQTSSQDFPTTSGVLQESDPSGTYPDIFVLKLSAQGSNLSYSTYVGGTQSDYAYDIKVRNNNAYVVGSTLSYDFPFVGTPNMNPHGTSLFFILNENGSNLLNSEFWGGWANEYAFSIDIQINGDIVVGGLTSSQDFPTTQGAYQTTTNESSNSFIVKYRPSTNTTLFSTYISGGSITSICFDYNNNISFTGWTNKPDEGQTPYPTTPGAFDRIINGSKDLFVSKLHYSGSELLFSTFIGGEGEENAGKIDVDDQGKVYLTGSINSGVNFTLPAACYDRTHNGEEDAFLAVLNPDLSILEYCTFLGGNLSDSGSACLLSGSDRVLITGTTSSSNFPITNGTYQTENKGDNDIFVTIFRIGDLIRLDKGWNLISIPYIQSETNLDKVLFCINSDYDAVQWYNGTDLNDPWKHHKVGKIVGEDLLDLNETMSFWIHITNLEGTIFLYNGTQPSSNQTIQLHPGWNMVGYPSLSNHNRTVGLNNLEFGTDVDAIQWFDAATKTWHFMGPDDPFVPGRGYWMHSKVDTTWEVPI